MTGAASPAPVASKGEEGGVTGAISPAGSVQSGKLFLGRGVAGVFPPEVVVHVVGALVALSLSLSLSHISTYANKRQIDRATASAAISHKFRSAVHLNREQWLLDLLACLDQESGMIPGHETLKQTALTEGSLPCPHNNRAELILRSSPESVSPRALVPQLVPAINRMNT